MEINTRKVIVEELISLIERGNAHASFEDVVEGVALDLLTVIPENLPYGIWGLVEHIRITQWDILKFCTEPEHQSPKWPDEYWPDKDATVTKEQWEDTLKHIHEDREDFFALLRDETKDLYEPFSYGGGQSIFREALLIADHNSYHMGQIIIVRRLLNNWKT